jgi:hypothetical protein
MGLKCKEAQKTLQDIIDKMRDLKFPKFWSETLDLISDPTGISIKVV